MNVTLLVFALLASSEPAAGPALELIHHPEVEAHPGYPIVLRVDTNAAWRVRALTAHFRTAGESEYRQVPLLRSAEGHFAAALPVPYDQQTRLEYHLTAQVDEALLPVFASADAPHPVLVHVPPAQRARTAMLEAYAGRRSRGSFFSEVVNFGSLDAEVLSSGEVDAQRTSFPDWYYRGELDYLHRLFESLGPLRIDSIRIGMGHMRAMIPPENALRPGPLPSGSQRQKPGLDYGFSEVEFSFVRGFGMAGKLLLGGNIDGFAAGGGARVRIGEALRSRVELEGEFIGGIGASGTFRLAWDTVPSFPMSAAVQLSNAPLGPWGVRVTYRADWELPSGFTVGGLIGYQARRAVRGGLSAGLATSVSW
jgi:hypothetical protein